MSGVGIIPKVALTTARIAHKPFELPTNMTNSALVTAGATYNFVGKTTQAARESFEALQPRGPVKLIGKLFDHTDAATAKSIGMADTNTKVFWKPMSEAAESVGQAVVNPVAAFYASKAGFADPNNPDLLRELIHSKGYPKPAEQAAPPAQAQGGEPTPTAAPTPDAAPAAAPTPDAAPAAAPAEAAPAQG